MNNSYASSESSSSANNTCPTSSPLPSTPASETTDLDRNDSDGLPAVLPRPHKDEFVLITGALGYIGSHTTFEVLMAGYNVVLVDNLNNSHISVLESIRSLVVHYRAASGKGDAFHPLVEFHCVDYQDEDAMRAILQKHTIPSSNTVKSNIVGVIHFAALKVLSESIQEPLKYYRNNLTGFIDLLSLLGEFSIKTFVFSSSAAIYGSPTNYSGALQESHCVQPCERLFSVADVTEAAPLPQACSLDISNPYGRSKYMAEAILSDLVISDPSWTVVVLRYFNPIGCDAMGMLRENPKTDMCSLLPIVMQTVQSRSNKLKIYGGDWDTPDGTAIRDFIHVSDLARGHTAALAACRESRLKGPYRTFNLGTGHGQSVLEVIRAVEFVSGRTVPFEVVDRRPGDVACSIAAVDRARSELGWEAEKSLRDACLDMCNSLQLLYNV